MGVRLLLLALLLLGLPALAGGVGMVADPSGEALALPLTLLDDSPFTDFRIPGLILLTVLGALPLAVAWSLYRGQGWSRYGALFVGCALTIWIAVEIQMIGFHQDPPFQAGYGALGLIIIALSMLPGVRERSRARGAPRGER